MGDEPTLWLASPPPRFQFLHSSAWGGNSFLGRRFQSYVAGATILVAVIRQGHYFLHWWLLSRWLPFAVVVVGCCCPCHAVTMVAVVGVVGGGGGVAVVVGLVVDELLVI